MACMYAKNDGGGGGSSGKQTIAMFVVASNNARVMVITTSLETSFLALILVNPHGSLTGVGCL